MTEETITARRTPDAYLMRENERLKAELDDKQAQLDYVYMMSGIEPLDDDNEGVVDDGAL